MSSIEDSIAESVRAAVAPLAEQLRRQADELAALRRALPPTMGSIDDAARVLGCSRRTVTRALKAGDVPFRRLGKRVLIDLSALRPASNDVVEREAEKARAAR